VDLEEESDCSISIADCLHPPDQPSIAMRSSSALFRSLRGAASGLAMPSSEAAVVSSRAIVAACAMTASQPIAASSSPFTGVLGKGHRSFAVDSVDDAVTASD
jgi:hypothetical protein